jgi:hypothetical protein
MACRQDRPSIDFFLDAWDRNVGSGVNICVGRYAFKRD